MFGLFQNQEGVRELLFFFFSRIRELKSLGNTDIHTFLTTQEHGVPLQMSDQLNAGATSETTRTLKTIHNTHLHIHSNKANMKG